MKKIAFKAITQAIGIIE